MENEYEILINAVELASELANEKMQNGWDYRDGKIYISDGHGGLMYSETAQDIFNDLYDIYYDLILKCKTYEKLF
jgi:PHP family Zn ribbon phosphoesterase